MGQKHKARPAGSVRATADRKAARKAAQSAAEARNREIRSAGNVPPSEALWGDLKARMAERRVVRAQERRDSPWRRVNPPQRGPQPKLGRNSTPVITGREAGRQGREA
jgi:hypothetical protein